MLIIMYLYFTLELIFHLETSKNDKYVILLNFVKYWSFILFYILAIFQVHVHEIFNYLSNKTVVDGNEATGFDVINPLYVMLPIYITTLSLLRQVSVNQRKQLFFNQVFQMKNLVIELVKIAGRWVGGQTGA